MAEVQALEYGVTNNNLPNKPTNLFLSNVNKENGSMDIYQLPLGPLGPRTLVMTSSKSSDWKPVLTDEGKKLTPDYQKFLLSDVSKEADNQRAAYINKNFTKVQKETLFKGAPKVNNIAAPSEAAEGGDSQSGNDESGEVAKQVTLDELKGIKDKAGGVRQSYGNYTYPIDLKNTKQDRIKFTMYRYKPKPFNERGIITGDAFGKREIKNPMGSVTLPIQPSITDTNTVDWGGNTMSPLDQAFSGLALSGIAGGSEGLSSAAQGAQEGLPKASGSLKTAAAATFAERAAGLKGGLLQRLSGGVTNPNLELLFNGPQLRSFTFSFTMSARTPTEAREIKNIIRLFKQGMSVKRSETNLFLMSPNIFEIKYFYGGGTKEHPWINKIKECALQNLTVNYTPAGNYATYYDGSMTSYEISLTFGEIEPLYDDDYTSLPGGDSDTSADYQIGY